MQTTIGSTELKVVFNEKFAPDLPPPPSRPRPARSNFRSNVQAGHILDATPFVAPSPSEPSGESTFLSGDFLGGSRSLPTGIL